MTKATSLRIEASAPLVRRRFTALLLGALLLAAQPALALDTATVELREVDAIHAADGVVEAIRQADVAAQIAGRIVALKANAGDRVTQGQVLARIDEREAAQVVASSRAQVARAQAELANAQVNLDRARKLIAEKYVSQAALDKAQADYDAASAALAAARAGAGQAETARGYAVITAPFSGYVAERHMNLGDLALPGKPIFTIYDPAALRVRADVPEDVVGGVRERADAAVAEVPAIDQTFKPKAVTVLPSANVRTHTKEVRLDLPEDVKGVYPGMFAHVRFSTGRAKRVVVPASAIAYRSEVAGAYVVNGGGEIRFRQVRVGERIGDRLIEVLAGLAPGERVATDPVAALAQLKARAK
jgi:RND family efflux transporter MFP subunit